MGIKTITLNAEVKEVAIAIQRLREQFAYKKNQLSKALGREPHPDELLYVCDRELEVMSNLHRVLEQHDLNGYVAVVSRIPDSLLGCVFLTKVRDPVVLVFPGDRHEQL
jgi:hypothetical protein